MYKRQVFCGFSGETEEDFQETLEVMRLARLDSAFMFKYSERPGTYASRHLVDDVPEEVKVERLNRCLLYTSFVLIYMPCVATVVAVSKELNSGWWGLFVVVYTCVLAWIVAYLARLIGLLIIQ